MGQGAAQQRTVISVSVFQPMLMPRGRGETFVILRTVSSTGEQLSEDRIERFPTARPVPVTTIEAAPGRDAFLPVIEVVVVHATDVAKLRAGEYQTIATVPVPLRYFLHLCTSSNGAPVEGASACLWLGLEEGGAGAAGDQRAWFERARVLGGDLMAPKVAIGLRSSSGNKEAGNSGWRLSQAACADPPPMTKDKVDGVGRVLDEADTLIQGLHSSVEELRNSGGDFAALEEDNARLRATLAQQRDKHQAEIAYLREQVREANGEPAEPPAEAKKDGPELAESDPAKEELRKVREKLTETKAEAERLKGELGDQQARIETIERHAAQAERAKGEALQLFSVWHEDIRWIGARLGVNEQLQDKLEGELRALQRAGERSPNGVPAQWPAELEGNMSSGFLQRGEQSYRQQREASRGRSLTPDAHA